MSGKETFVQVTQRKDTKGESYYSFDYCSKGSPFRMGCKWGKWKTLSGVIRAIKRNGYVLLTDEVYVYV